MISGPDNTHRRIAIAGGGIGGLTAALALSRRGFEVDVHDSAAVFHEVGAGIQQSPNAMAVHAALGIAGDIEARAFAPQFAALMDGPTGRVHLKTDLASHRDRYGYPYLHIHRADLHHVLLGAAKAQGIRIHLGSAVTGYRNMGGHIDVVAGGQTSASDVLIGADGIRSKVADGMFGVHAPRFTGQVAWRALVPASAVRKGLIPPAANVWMGDGKHLVAYYVRGGDLINVVAVLEQQALTQEAWTLPGNPEALRNAFSDFEPRVRKLLDAVQDCHIWGLFDHAPLQRWTDGRAALLGDAAHPMLPFMAQGAAMAIEDAWVLADHLDGVSDVEAALKSYADRRRARTSHLQAISRANAGLYHQGPGPARVWRNTKLAIANTWPKLADTKLSHIYGWKPC